MTTSNYKDIYGGRTGTGSLTCGTSMDSVTSHVDSVSYTVSSNASTVTLSKNYRAANYYGGLSTQCDGAYGTYSLSSFAGTATYTKPIGWAGGTATGRLTVTLYGVSGSGQGYYSQISSQNSGVFNN